MDIWVCMAEGDIYAVFSKEADARQMLVRTPVEGGTVELRSDYDGSGGYGHLAIDIWNVWA